MFWYKREVCPGSKKISFELLMYANNSRRVKSAYISLRSIYLHSAGIPNQNVGSDVVLNNKDTDVVRLWSWISVIFVEN